MKPTEQVEAQKWFDYDQDTFVVTASLAKELATNFERVTTELATSKSIVALDQLCRLTDENTDLKRQLAEATKALNYTLKYLRSPEDDSAELVERMITAAIETQKGDGWHYFKVHETGCPLPIDTEINCHGAWHLAATYPQYDATKNYQARVKK